MRTTRCHAKDLAELLMGRKIATMAEMKAALRTDVDVTVFRKLKELRQRTSYSHRGRYYTLDNVARFDDRGLWSCQSVWFSKFGTLVRTAEAFVKESEAGYFAGELENILSVSVKQPLLKLVRQGRISRREVAGRYLYCAADQATKRRQLSCRRAREAAPSPRGAVPRTEFLPDELRAAIILFASLLDEKQQRLYAGVESLKLGHGGDRRIAELLGIDVGTVARGRRELLGGDMEAQRVRKAGGRRRPVEKKRRRSSPGSES